MGATWEPSTPTLPGRPTSLAKTSRRELLAAPKSARKVHHVEVPLGRVAVARVAIGEPPRHRQPVLERAAGDDRHVEAAPVPGDDARARAIEPAGEVGQQLRLRFAFADAADLLRHVVVEEQAAEGDDLVEGRRRHRATRRPVVELRQLGIGDGLDVEDEMRRHPFILRGICTSLLANLARVHGALYRRGGGGEQ